MSAKSIPSGTNSNLDAWRRWSRKMKWFRHIKTEVEPQRQQLLALRGACWRRARV